MTSNLICKVFQVFLCIAMASNLYAHPLERDCCRKKTAEAERALSLANDLLRGGSPSAYVVSGVVDILGAAAATPLGWGIIAGSFAVAKALQYHAKVLQRKYQKCLNGHIREHEMQLKAEELRKKLLQEAYRAQQKAIQDERDRLDQAQAELERAEYQMHEAEKHFEIEKAHRMYVLEEYRNVWHQISQLEARLNHNQQQNRVVKQKISDFNFYSHQGDEDFTALEPFSSSIDMEIHGPDSYGSEPEWIDTYYQHTKKVLVEEARRENRDILEQATQRDQQINSKLQHIQKQVETLHEQLDHGNDQIDYLREQTTKYHQAAQECYSFWPELDPLRRRVQQERYYFEKSLDCSQKRLPQLHQSVENSQTQLNHVQNKLASMQNLKHKIDHAEAQLSSMEYQEQRQRAIDHAKVVASELPKIITENGSSSEEYSLFYEVSEMMIDLGLSLNPITGAPRDLYEALSGKHILTGEELSTFERSIAVVGVLTLGVGSKILKASNVVFTGLFKGLTAQKSFHIGTEAFEAAHETWAKEIDLVHIVKGEFGEKAVDGTFALKSGMHTMEGFTEFLALSKLSGKTYEIKEVSEFTLEKIPDGGPILMQTLSNGVTRLQLPRDAFLNGPAYNKGLAYNDNGLRIKGSKTLWPDSFDIQNIVEFTDKIKEIGIKTGNEVEGAYQGIKIQIYTHQSGKISTSFPRWRQ